MKKRTGRQQSGWEGQKINKKGAEKDVSEGDEVCK